MSNSRLINISQRQDLLAQNDAGVRARSGTSFIISTANINLTTTGSDSAISFIQYFGTKTLAVTSIWVIGELVGRIRFHLLSNITGGTILSAASLYVANAIVSDPVVPIIDARAGVNGTTATGGDRHAVRVLRDSAGSADLLGREALILREGISLCVTARPSATNAEVGVVWFGTEYP